MKSQACTAVTIVAVALTAAVVGGEGGSNLDYWLDRAAPAPATTSAPAPASSPAHPTGGAVSREDALPGAIELSDGRLLAGRLYTTAGKDLEIWVDAEKRWRHAPLVILRGLHAVVVDEGAEPEWRWKAMGDDEKVYTGRSRPVRRLQWRANLIDGTSLTGEIKGQPLWIEHDGRRTLHLLAARTKSAWGQTLDQLVYPTHIVFSRREMRRIAAMAAEGNSAP